jgi:predicted Zn-dependent protease
MIKPENQNHLRGDASKRWVIAVSIIILAAVVSPRATSESEGAELEGIHIESLIAQSVGMERRFQNQNLFFEDRDMEEYLDEILESLATPDENRQFMLKVRVLRSGAVNAFASPHGTVYVCTGLLARITSEAQAAALLAHELAHIISFHAPKNLVALKAHARSKAHTRRGLPLMLGDGAAVGITGAALRAAVSGYTSGFEREADSVGLARMAAAGYPHGEFRSLFVMLGEYVAAEKIDEPYFFSSHPRIAERLANYNLLVSALDLADDVDCGGIGVNKESVIETDIDKIKSQVNHARKGNCMEDDIRRKYFNIKVANVVLYDAAVNLAAGRYETVEAQLGRLFSVDSGDVAALVMRGDMERMLSPRSTDAVRWYEKALSRDPDNAAALRAAGFAYHSTGDFDKARVNLRKYCKIVPDAPDIKMAKEALRQCGK